MQRDQAILTRWDEWRLDVTEPGNVLLFTLPFSEVRLDPSDMNDLIPARGLANSLGLPKSSQVEIDGGEGEIRQAPGHPGKLNTAQREALAAMVESGPMPAIHGVVRWRLKDLAMWVWEEFRVSVSETTLSRILRALGYRKLSARPRHHAQAAGAVDAFKKRSPSAWTRSRATRGSIATG